MEYGWNRVVDPVTRGRSVSEDDYTSYKDTDSQSVRSGRRTYVYCLRKETLDPRYECGPSQVLDHVRKDLLYYTQAVESIKHENLVLRWEPRWISKRGHHKSKEKCTISNSRSVLDEDLVFR